MGQELGVKAKRREFGAAHASNTLNSPSLYGPCIKDLITLALGCQGRAYELHGRICGYLGIAGRYQVGKAP